MEKYELDIKAQEIAASNVQQALEHGPKLRCTTGTFVIAKDIRNGWVLLGGLGGMGVGQMWFGLEERHKSYANFDSAPDIDTDKQDALLDYVTGKIKVTSV